MTYCYVQAREKKPGAPWITHARASDHDLAYTMAQLIEEGFGDHPGGVAQARAAVPGVDLSAGDVATAERELAAETEGDAQYRAELEAAARERLGRS